MGSSRAGGLFVLDVHKVAVGKLAAWISRHAVRDLLPGHWGACLVEECHQALEVLLPLSKVESDFLDKLLDYGKIEPSLLTEDEGLAKRIRYHPALEWKALNVRRHKSH